MEFGFCSALKGTDSFLGLKNLDEDDEELKPALALPAIPHPQTPKEPMDFLARSWSLSGSEVSRALDQKQKQFCSDSNPVNFPAETFVTTPQLAEKVVNSINSRSTGLIGKWFHHHKEFGSSTIKKKDRMRIENAHLHSAVSVAGLAAGLAAVAAAWNSSSNGSKMCAALASATELLASHCAELAESAGAEHTHVASVIKSATDVRSPGDLMTLTAAAATALRGEAALKARLPKEAKKSAAISPYDRSVAVHWPATSPHSQIKEHNPPCEGELLQQTPKGVLRWKHACVYINKKSQVIVKLKSKQVGGAFSKKNKYVVHGVCNETAAWPYRKERENSEALYFGLKTAKDLLEFKCKSKVHKQRWVDGVQSLLHHACYAEPSEFSLESLSISNNST